MEVPGRISAVELLDIQIVNIPKRMRNAPGHLRVVREVRKGRHARDSEADRIELIAAQMHLRVHARQLESAVRVRSEEHTSELQSQSNLVCRLLLEKKKKTDVMTTSAIKMAAQLR